MQPSFRAVSKELPFPDPVGLTVGTDLAPAAKLNRAAPWRGMPRGRQHPELGSLVSSSTLPTGFFLRFTSVFRATSVPTLALSLRLFPFGPSSVDAHAPDSSHGVKRQLSAQPAGAGCPLTVEHGRENNGSTGQDTGAQETVRSPCHGWLWSRSWSLLAIGPRRNTLHLAKRRCNVCIPPFVKLASPD